MGDEQENKRRNIKRKQSTSDQVKDILNDIAPDDDDDDDKVQQDAYQKRKTMGRPRAKSKGDELLEMLDNVDHNVDVPSIAHVATKYEKDKEKTKSKRPTRKDKQRRPSDQVKDILDNIAPEDDEEENVDIKQEIAIRKRKNIKR